MCPQLAILLKMRYNILSVGTCRTNRKGWPRELLHLKKNSSEKGDYIVTYDNINQVACMQWCDSKIVNLVSTLNDARLSVCRRRVGMAQLNIPVPNDYNEYSSKMFGVDKGDQARSHFGGFANRSHFHKWYKKVYLAILDCAILNAHAAWNMSCAEMEGRNSLKRHEFIWSICIDLLNYKDMTNVSIEVPVARASLAVQVSLGSHVPVENNAKRKRCCVCQLETNMSDHVSESGLRSKGVCICGNGDCCIAAHNHIPRDNSRLIRTIDEFRNLTCFEIAHHPSARGIWRQSMQGYSTCPAHPLVKRLKSLHGNTPTIRRPRARVNDGREPTLHLGNHLI